MSRVYLLMTLGRIISLLPESRLFRLKAFMYRKIGGLDIDPTAELYSSVRLYVYPIRVGARTHVGTSCLFIGATGCPIEIGSDCDIAPEVAFLTGTHEIGTQLRRAGKGKAGPIRVGDGTWIGARSVILQGITIGSGCIVAAGSVVTSNIAPNTLVAGVPAKPKKNLPISIESMISSAGLQQI
jgi:acetyltransferase-like isoleucine patch superfamily enzyme